MATYYLNADTGANGNPGTSALPWETFFYAESQMSNGDTVIAQDSTATYAIANTTINVSITLTGESVTGVVFDGAAGAPTWTTQADFTVSLITFQNLTGPLFQHASFGLSDVDLAVNSCIIADLAAAQGNVLLFDYGTDCTATFTGCLFYNIALNSTQALVYWQRNGETNQDVYFYNCTFYFDDTDIGGLLRAIARDNRTGALSCTWVNCILYNASASAMDVDYAGLLPTTTYNNNCTYGTWTNIPAGSNNITVDPLMVGPANDNFNLRPTSPCIDTGTLI